MQLSNKHKNLITVSRASITFLLDQGIVETGAMKMKNFHPSVEDFHQTFLDLTVVVQR